MNSSFPGFYRLSLDERRELLARRAGVDLELVEQLSGLPGLDERAADRMVENALGVFHLPIGLCANLLIDDTDRVVPMVVEEPSVIAAASFAAKLIRAGGGVHTRSTAADMIGQVQLLDVPDPDAAEVAVLAARDELLRAANADRKRLVAAGGGAHDIELHRLAPLGDDDPLGPMLIVHLIADVRDAMGANAVNSMCEATAPILERLTGGRARLRILSNLSDRRLITVEGRVPLGALGSKHGSDGAAVARGIVEASVFAERDPYRAATHNKGIMNGVDAVLIALGQDWRAVEAGAHAFAAKAGRYTALARWRVEDGALVGRMSLPMAVGVVGGVVKVHPAVQAAMAIAGVSSAVDLGGLAASVGLAQNLGALRALADEGIQRGHMRLHARNVAVEAGAVDEEVTIVAERIAAAGTVNLDAALSALQEVRSQ